MTGYSDAEGGRLVVQRGNVDAIYPNSPEANARRERGEFSAAAFHPARGSLALAQAADFLGAGDFDADGHWDIVTAARGGTKLCWLRGDGRGNFEAAQVTEMAGSITALAVGQVNRVDGLTDIAVGVAATDGARVLIFESCAGALRGAPESFPLAAPAVDFAFGELGEDGWRDLAIASGSEVVLVHGRDRKLSLDAEQQAKVPPATLSRSVFETEVVSIAVGDFAGDVKQELAALTADGSVRVLDRPDVAALYERRISSADRTTVTDRRYTLQVGEGATSPMRLVAAKVSALPKDDLLVFGGSNEVRIATTREPDRREAAGTVVAEGSPRLAMSASVSADSAIAAVLPMRLNSDALKDLVLVTENGGPPTVIESQNTVFVVNSTARTSDVAPGNGVCADATGACTFTGAIEESNALAGPDTIHFNIPGGGVPVVSTHASLEFSVFSELHQPVTIDGTTQPGAGRVEIDTESFGPLVFYGGNSVLRGVAIYNRNVSLVVASANNIIEGNYVGFRPDGSKPSFIGGISFAESGGHNNLIGGTTAQARNIISNCSLALSLSHTTGNVIQGNYVGLTIDGTAALANENNLQARGVSSDVTIGGATAGAGNVFSGATSGDLTSPVRVDGGAVIQGNRFGTTADGMQPIPNGGFAISVFSNQAVTIGGTTPVARNIMGASHGGIYFEHDTGGNALVQGNYIGTNAAGNSALPNRTAGMMLSGTRGVVVGGAAPGAGNLISGNTKHGLELVGGINGTPCRGVTVQGNLIGTDVSGTIALANQESGIYLQTTDNVQVGGTTAAEHNVVSGNTKHGFILGNATANPGRIQGNLIGVNIFGTGGLGNGQHGIHIENMGGHRIGGTEPGAGNIIAFNGGAGIASSFRDFLGGPILSNSIFANRGLGLDRLGNGVTLNFGSYSEMPVITSVTTSGSETVISGTLRTQTFGPQTPHTIQLFSNTSPDPSGYGEGQTFIGETTITAGGNVAVPFSATVPAVPPGRYISAVAIGFSEGATINGAPLTSEFSFNVRAPGDSSNNPLQLFALESAVGGNTGTATFTILGEGIQPGATIVLRLGNEEIVGIVTSVDGNGATAEVTFDLSGRAIGLWDVVVTNPNGSSVSLPATYTIEQGRAPNVWVDIIGRSIIRKGSPQTYHIVFGNRGNIDAPATVVRAFVTAGVIEVKDVGLLPEGYKPLILPNADGTTSVIFFVPKINAGATLMQTMKLVSPVETPESSARILVRARSSPGIQVAYERDADPTMVISDPQVIESTETSYKAKFQETTSQAAGELEISASITEVAAAEPFSVTTTQDGDSTIFTFSATYTTAVGISSLGSERAAGVNSETPNEGVISKIAAQVKVPTGSVNNLLRNPALSDAVRPLATNAQTTTLSQLVSNKAANNTRGNPPAAGKLLQQLGAMTKTADLVLKGNPANQGFHEAMQKLSQEMIKDSEKQIKEITETPEDADQRPLDEDEGVCVIPGNAGMRAWAGPDSPPLPGCNGNGGGSGGSGSLDVDIRTARDPNEKVGPKGQLPQHYVSGVEPMRYAIYFENQASATAPAQDVVITDQLDVSKLDLSTFELGPVHFGNSVVVTPPPGLSEWTTDIDLRPVNNLIVRVSATLNPTTGIATWRFISIDPATNQPTGDPIAGFLPPNKTAPEGDGGVAFTIKAKSGLTSGTEIRNKARIVFDANPHIDTPEWINTIDNSPPTSEVAALAPTQNSSSFEVAWSGSDSTSGIASYTIYVSENGGEYVVWLVNTSNTSGFYVGRPGATYSFYSIAQDGAGNSEAPPGPADTSTTTRFGQLLNIATRLRVQTGENVLIGGLIVTGADPKKVIIRGIGPSLSSVFAGVLENPKLELYQGNTLLASNDNWKDSQRTEIEATTIPPTHELESAIVHTLAPGSYTAIMSGSDGGTGIGVVEAYDLNQAANSKLANIATRGFVDSGDNVMIGGVIAGGNGGANTRVLIRAIGPSLSNAGIAGALQDPTLELRNANGALLRENDNWQAEQQSDIESTTIPPSNAAESAIVAVLTPGNYTAIVRGRNNTTGVALVEVYNVP